MTPRERDDAIAEDEAFAEIAKRQYNWKITPERRAELNQSKYQTMRRGREAKKVARQTPAEDSK